MKNEIYSEFGKMISKKIEIFTTDMKRMTISQEA